MPPSARVIVGATHWVARLTFIARYVTVFYVIHFAMIRGDMICKIHNIRGVGRFKDFECKEGIDLGKLTLIYSENGQGKSTLADILRALSDGDESRLLGRKTVGATDQFIKFDTEDGIRCFHNGSWNDSLGGILVFDEVFINDNIYEGLSVRPEQREKLHPIVVGKVQKLGVQKVQQLVAERDDITLQRTQVRRRIESTIGDLPIQPECRLSFDQFIKLLPVEDLDSRIASQQIMLEQLKANEQIQSNSSFRCISAIALPENDLKHLLQKRLSCIADDAKAVLQAHVDRFSGNEMERWLRQGTQYVSMRESETDDICPYCGLSLAKSSLIEHYQAIFEETYEAFETEVSTFSSRRLDFSSWIADAKSACESNSARAVFWANHLSGLEIPDLDSDLVEETLLIAVSEMNALLEEKQNALFTEIPVSPGLEAALNRLRVHLQEIDGYNEVIRRSNDSIGELRTRTASVDLVAAEREFAKLEYTELRYRKEVAGDCEIYLKLDQQWNELDGKVKHQRKENTKAIDDTFKQYGESIDRHLEAFGATFRIADLAETHHGGVDRADYMIELSGERIGLGQAKTDISERSFRNVLSEGDKRTLALGFFLSTIDAMSESQNKVVVFDDPVTSLDENRRMNTSEAIVEVSKRPSQVIVLSHRPDFLYSVWSDYMKTEDQKKEATMLEIRYDPNSPDTSIIGDDWDIHKAVKNYHANNIDNVLKFINGPVEHEPDHIWKLLRPILETHFQSCYPEYYRGEVNSLGKFIGCIVKSKPNSPLSAMKGEVSDELDRLNKRLTPSQHGGDPPPVTNRDQLIPYCRRVLALVGRPQSPASYTS